jgi:hypothetical protein
MTPGEICYKVYWLGTINPCIADSPEKLLLAISFKETYPYDMCHNGAIALGTLGSVLACFSL